MKRDETHTPTEVVKPLEAPLFPLGHDNGLPAWQQIEALFIRHGLPAPHVPLRHELVSMLRWAQYGEALHAAIAKADPTTEPTL